MIFRSYLWRHYVLLGAIVAFLDRFTKSLALIFCSEGCDVLPPFIKLRLVINRGVTWGMFSTAQGFPHMLMQIAVVGMTVGLVLYAMHRYQAGRVVWAESAVIGASCSNIFDRLVHGGVVDFIALGYKHWSWPIFNVADVFIVGGIAWMMLGAYRDEWGAV